MIPVTKPFLPPQNEFEKYVQKIWKSNWLTNNGPLVNQLESKLKEQLKVDNLIFVSNGTIAIQLAIKALGLSGEIITTPFSYIATTSSIVWENCNPVFVDIDKNNLNIDPNKIEDAITPKTSGILVTHVYGNSCDIKSIKELADRRHLKVIYDAAHCFGTNYMGSSVFSYGDISTTSFHATKIFHTIEGGAIFSKDKDLIDRMSLMRNFGHNGPGVYDGVGINAKNSELHAAMGLANLPFMAEILNVRKRQSNYYDVLLKNFNIRNIAIDPDTEYNYSYYPVIFEDEVTCLRTQKRLEENHIQARRYFFPSLNKLYYVDRNPMPISEDISTRVLCLPLYHDLSIKDQELITEIITKS